MKLFRALRPYLGATVSLLLVAGVSLLQVTGMGGLFWKGPRGMSPIVFEKRAPHGIEYLAEDDIVINKKNTSVMAEQLRALNRQYDDTLSQPIAITGWHGDAATWEVFFATNRDLVPKTEGGDQARFGNREMLTALHYGRAQIVLPWRRRGNDPNRGEPSAKTAGSPTTAEFSEVRQLSWDAMFQGVQSQLARSRQHDLLLFVHGFNVDFESALIRTAQIALDIPFNGAVVVAYSWPSQGGFHNYATDEPFNANSVGPFTEFLARLVAAVPEGTRINIVVHSMGNRIVMQAIGRLQPARTQKPIANLVLCAPDVGIADFKAWAPGVVARCDHVTLYASQGDAALIFSNRINFEQRAGDAYPPVCVPGIETIDVSGVDLNQLLGHSYYGSNLNVLSDLYFVLKENRPADKRNYLSRKSRGFRGDHYWQFTDHAPFIRCSWSFGETVTR